MDSVRERLERMKNNPRRVPSPLPNNEINPKSEKGLLSPESVFLRKIEKSMSQIKEIQSKMNSDSGQYLSLYYDLKKYEKEFLDLIDDPEIKFLDLPEMSMRRIKDLQSKIRNKKI